MSSLGSLAIDVRFPFSVGQQSQMYVNVSRSQTEEPKLEYSAYSSGSQHLTQQSPYLSESEFHVTPAKEEPSLFNTSQQQQQPSQQQQSSLPGTSSPAESSVGTQGTQEAPEQPTLADYNQSTSKGHEILSQVIKASFDSQGILCKEGNFLGLSTEWPAHPSDSGAFPEVPQSSKQDALTRASLCLSGVQLRPSVFEVGRVDPAHSYPHGSEALSVPHLHADIFAKRPPHNPYPNAYRRETLHL